MKREPRYVRNNRPVYKDWSIDQKFAVRWDLRKKIIPASNALIKASYAHSNYAQKIHRYKNESMRVLRRNGIEAGDLFSLDRSGQNIDSQAFTVETYFAFFFIFCIVGIDYMLGGVFSTIGETMGFPPRIARISVCLFIFGIEMWAGSYLVNSLHNYNKQKEAYDKWRDNEELGTVNNAPSKLSRILSLAGLIVCVFGALIIISIIPLLSVLYELPSEIALEMEMLRLKGAGYLSTAEQNIASLKSRYYLCAVLSWCTHWILIFSHGLLIKTFSGIAIRQFIKRTRERWEKMNQVLDEKEKELKLKVNIWCFQKRLHRARFGIHDAFPLKQPFRKHIRLLIAEVEREGGRS